MYLRKSRSDNANESMEETLHKHEIQLFALAKKLKINTNDIIQFKEVVSGENIENRPEMQRLLDLVMDNVFTGVLVVDSQRLARGDTLDQGTIIRAFSINNTKIITPQKITDPKNEFDQEYLEFELFMGRREYKMINRRMQRGRQISVQEGYYIGSIAPYGYSKIKDEHGHTLALNKEEYSVVQMIFSLYTKDKVGCGQIANILNTKNIIPRKADRWTTSAINNIIDNIYLYCGYVTWDARKEVKVYRDGKIIKTRPRNAKPKIYKGKHPALFDDEFLHSVLTLQANKNTARVPKQKELKNPLAGLFVCCHCGRKMIRRKYRNQAPIALVCRTNQCHTVSSYLDIVEHKILEAIKIHLTDYTTYYEKNKTQEPQKMNNEKELIDTCDKEIKKLKQQLDKICNLLEEGIYTVELFKERKTNIEEKITKIKDRKKTIRGDLRKKKQQNIKYAIPILENAIELYWSATVEEKNKLLKAIIEKVIYKKEEDGRYKNANTDDFDLQIYFKI